MPWVRLDDQFYQHPKLARVGPLGIAMQVAGLCYCNHYLTDGTIPWSAAQSLLSWQFIDDEDKRYRIGISCGMKGEDATAEFVIGLLVDAGIWEEDMGGYRIHDYDKYQPSREDALREQAQKRAAGQAGGQASAKARAQAKSKPVPVPVPVPNPEPEVPTEPSGGSHGFSAHQIVEIWNEQIDGVLPKVERLSDGRKRSVKARLAADKSRDADWWRAYFERIKATAFCVGENNNGWRATFDWAVRSEDVIAKVLEGNYERAANGQALIRDIDWGAEVERWTR